MAAKNSAFLVLSLFFGFLKITHIFVIFLQNYLAAIIIWVTTASFDFSQYLWSIHVHNIIFAICLSWNGSHLPFWIFFYLHHSPFQSIFYPEWPLSAIMDLPSFAMLEISDQYDCNFYYCFKNWHQWSFLLTLCLHFLPFEIRAL